MSSDSRKGEGEGGGQGPADKQTPGRRRGFLLGAGTVGAAGVAAVTLGSRSVRGPGEGAPDPVRGESSSKQGRGYHETAHIRKYYDTTKV